MNKSRRMVKQLVSWLLVMTLVCTCAPISVQAAKKVKLNKTSVKLKVGKTVKLKLKNNKKKVKWSSANKKIATVNKSGLVKAKKKGKTRIIAKVKKKKYICKITVEAKKTEKAGNNNVTDDDPQGDDSDQGGSDDDERQPNHTVKPEPTPDSLKTPAPWETPNPWTTTEPTLAPWETSNPWATTEPTLAPWETSSPWATSEPTLAPWETPSPWVTTEPTLAPWETPNPWATTEPTLAPWETPSPWVTTEPTLAPWETPSPGATSTATPTVKPTATPTVKPTATPTIKPTATPTVKPTATPTIKPTATPTIKPTATPTVKPTATPTIKPTATPTIKPTATPTIKPTTAPTVKPTATPTPTVTPGTDLPSGATVFAMGTKKLAIGMTEAAVKAALGSSYRTGKSPQGFDTIAYNASDYSEYLLLYLQDGKVAGICGIGKAMSFGDAAAGQNGNTLSSSWLNVSDYKTTSGKVGAKKSAGAGSEMAYVFLDALGDNTIYCIQVFDTSKITQTEDMIYKTTNLSYDTAVTASIATETGHMLNTFRAYRSMRTYYFYDGLAQCAQLYCNSITATKINARNSNDLLNAMFDCNVDPMNWGESCYYDAADAISFANSLIEMDAFYTAMLMDSNTYRYIGVGMAATGSHTYMAVDYVDEY